MIIKSYELKRKLNEKNDFYLLYGQNSGLIEDIINKNLKPIFSKNIYHYDEIELISNKDEILEGLVNESLFEEDRLIIISRVTDKLLDLIKEVLEKEIKNIKIILKSNNLEKKSKLRNFFEKNEKLIIIPVYEDSYQTLISYAQNFFKENKIKISPENINYILEKSKGNRINLKNELEKIKNYSHSKKAIEFKDLIKLICLNETHAISELTDQCLAKNKKKTLNILNENNSSVEDNILILRSFLFKLKRLKKLKGEMETKKNLDQIISTYKPPIFWKDKEIIKRQLNTLSMADIKKFIKKVNELELLNKKNSSISNEITYNFILEAVESSNNLI